MSEELKAKESLHHGLRRVCRHHVKKALEQLSEQCQAKAVHAVRKEIKKLRAVFRLSRNVLNKHDYRKAMKAMRLAGKPLSVPRDALVTRQAMRKLPSAKTRAFTEIHSSLEIYLNYAERQYEEASASSVTGYILEKLPNMVCPLKKGHFDWHEAGPSLRKSYARGRLAYLRALRTPTPDNFHEWRKKVKNLRYQLNFLCPDWPARTKSMIENLKSLSDQLGDDHDLMLLGNFTAENCAHCKEKGGLSRFIDSKRKECEDRAWSLGARLFEDRPKKASRQFHHDWKKWRHNR